MLFDLDPKGAEEPGGEAAGRGIVFDVLRSFHVAIAAHFGNLHMAGILGIESLEVNYRESFYGHLEIHTGHVYEFRIAVNLKAMLSKLSFLRKML